MANAAIIGAAAVLGLVAGSFLNVVIHRGPALLGLLGEDRRARGTFAGPRSRCPRCDAAIAARDLVPLASFALLRGRCRACGAKISLRYPLVEAAGAAAALLALSAYGATFAAAFAFLYLLGLVALAAIDHETGYLPDALTVPLIAGGIAANAGAGFTTIEASLIGAIAGYSAFWFIAAAYRVLRKREGLGGGDAKLLAAIGAWSGWTALAPAVFVASLFALAAVAVLALRGRPVAAETAIRFGPALCAAGALVHLAPAFL